MYEKLTAHQIALDIELKGPKRVTPTRYSAPDQPVQYASTPQLVDGKKQIMATIAAGLLGFGLVGAAVVTQGDIAGLVLSCRVLGLGVEHEFMDRIIGDLGHAPLTGRIIPTARNAPVRNLYRDHAFEPLGEGVWQRAGAR